MIRSALPKRGCLGPGLYWKPLMSPSGNYSLRLAPAAARVAGKTMMMNNTPCLLTILMAMALRRYVSAHIAQWRRSRAMLDATGHYQRASIAADSSNWSCMHHFFRVFSLSTCYKRAWADDKAPNNNKGMTYQSDGKELNNTMSYLVGEVNIVEDHNNNPFMYCIDLTRSSVK